MKKAFLFSFVLVLCCAFSGVLMAAEQMDPSKILVCSKVFAALGKIGDNSPEAKSILMKGLEEKDFFLRAYAAESLGYLDVKDAIPLLKKLVDDENYLVRVYATAALVRLGGLQESALLSLLKDADPQVRGNAVDQLSSFGEKYFPAIYETLLNDDNDFVRTEALMRLGENRFTKADGSKIIPMLASENTEVRQAACFALGQIGYAQAVPQLTERLKDKESKVRASAKIALSHLADRSIIDLLWQDAGSKDEYLCGSSYVALANLREIDALPAILKGITAPESTPFVRIEAAVALSIFRDYISGSVDKALTEGNKKPVQPSRNLQINYAVGDQSLVSIFINAINDKKDALHKDIPEVLIKFNVMDCVPFLREAMLKDDPDTAAASAYALGILRDREALKSLIEICKKYGCG